VGSEWKEMPLSELYDFRSGLSKPRSEFGFGYGFLSFKDVFYNIFVPEKLTELVNSTEKERESCSIKRGDVFLTRTSETMDELGMSCVALKDYEHATFNGFTKRLRPKENANIIPEYAGYFFRSPRFRSEVTAMSTLSTRASLNNEMLGRLKMILPSIKEQTIIGFILKSLDDKIELNRQMNEILETMAQTIFKSWFMDFEPVRAKVEGRDSCLPKEIVSLFPNSFEDSALGKIPKGWKVKQIGQICEVRRGASPRPIHEFMNGKVPWLKIADATSSPGPFIRKTKELLKEEGQSKSVRVKPGDLILSNSATCGVPIFVDLYGCIHDGWLYFSNITEISYGYLYHFLKKIAEELIRIADGSVQKNLNTKLIASQKILVPTQKIVSFLITITIHYLEPYWKI
jgi:type I restriction enzyme S subunit